MHQAILELKEMVSYLQINRIQDQVQEKIVIQTLKTEASPGLTMDKVSRKGQLDKH